MGDAQGKLEFTPDIADVLSMSSGSGRYSL